MMVFSGSANQELTRRLAKELGVKLRRMELSRFVSDEIRVRVREKKVAARVVVVQSLSRPTNDNLVEVCLIADALRRKGVKEMIGVIPWLGYSKQDQVFREGEPLSAEVAIRILETAGFKRIVTMDLHKEELLKLFRTPAVHLSARKLLLEEFKKTVDRETMVVAPDVGAGEFSREFARDLGVGAGYIDKERDLETGEVKIKGVKGKVKGRRVIMVDDMVVTGQTLIETAKFLKKQGVQSIEVGVTHHLNVPGVQQKLDKSPIDRLVVTDTIESRIKSKKVKVLSVAGIIAEAIGG